MSTVYRHKLRGTTFTVIGRAMTEVSTSRILTEGAPAIVYKDDADRLYVRHADEFHDGRFEAMPAARQWWPTHYMDESMPAGTASPDDWIVGAINDRDAVFEWILAPPDRQDTRTYGIVLVDEGAPVNFAWMERRGRGQMIIYPDATWHIEGGMPEGVTHIHDADEPLFMADTPEDFARLYCSHFHLLTDDELHCIDVIFTRWGDARFRLVDEPGTTARFVPIEEPAPAEAGGGNG